ncbi:MULTISPECIES: FecCD family ABC transporter permease [unclassified Paenibacillus]|uniref:FecCD family ABC transporter permease n=1 Tax=unclassified Paenibacillus TaxID=185978 RepID=UPI000301D3AF|nr:MULTISPECIES: iron ABC transporter permease [unclassified Paenibacillus]MCM3337668.1 iron ABC transporter permease [Paenibacillus sp. MER TA 81-3]
MTLLKTLPHHTPLRTRPWAATVIICAGLFLIVIGIGASIVTGVANITFGTVWNSIVAYDAQNDHHVIIRELRMPRALAGALVGAAFAVAGAIMQGMTRNPIADTGLLGINAGAGFVLVLVFAFVPWLPFKYIILFSFIGAGLGALLVYGIAFMSRGGLSPLKLVLAGAVVGSLITGLSQALTLLFQINYDLAFWTAGGISTAEWFQVSVMLPWIIGGLLVAMLISRSITILSLGEDVAAGLGQRTGLIKGIGTFVVMILAGASVSTVGGVGFIGLIIPHLARFLVGVDYRWIIPCSAILGGALVVYADMGAKLIALPYETPLGSIIAVIGVPFFLYLARKERREL